MTGAPGNAPQALANAPLPLLGDPRCQMSFGERAALEGVLAQLWPSLSVEVGSAAGGSLERVACYSDEVHSFDLVVPDSEVTVPQHVVHHVGNSHETLGPWLEDLGDRGGAIDFALIDGDHTADGVRLDLLDLLAAYATARTVILLHDTANPGVREGLQGIDLDFHPKVVYLDLDLLAGYEFADGPFEGQRWGGLGLIVTGDRSTDGYGETPAQTLYRRRHPDG